MKYMLLKKKSNNNKLNYKNKTKNRKSSIKSPGGLIYFKPIWGGGGLNRDGGLIWEGGGLFNLEKTMVSILHKKLKYNVETLKYKRLEVMQPRIKNKPELLVGK